MKKLKRKILTAILTTTLLFSTAPSVYGAVEEENQTVTEIETSDADFQEEGAVVPSQEETEKSTEMPGTETDKTEPYDSINTPKPSQELSKDPAVGQKPEEPKPEEAKPGWNENDGEKFYLDENLKRVTGWKVLSGAWYYFDTEGIMQTGWKAVNGKWYYLGTDGRMQTGWVKDGDNWYFTDAGGAMQTGWLLRGNSWFYLTGSGAMAQGWGVVNGNWYYFRPENGDMMTGWLQDKDAWYYLSGSGAMQTGWLLHGSSWYYLSESGKMAQGGWHAIGGKWYYLDSNGRMKTGWVQSGNLWYYLSASGAMQTGWFHIGSIWYWADVNGTMQTGWQEIGSSWYYFNADGAMQTGWQVINNKWYYLGGSNDGAMKTGWINDGRKNYYLKPDGEWKCITLAVVGYNDADAITTAAKFGEMGASVVIVTGSFDPSQYDGVIIPGGGDLDPSRYGQANTASKNIDNALDDRQIDAVQKCAQAGKPVFGICKGMQLINVAFGGTLNQDIRNHMNVWHPATVVSSGWFSEIYFGSVKVLSFHHQSVQYLASGFQVDMRANDGTIEAISNNAKQIYGVQFHPEQMNDDTGNRCIKKFVETCTK